MTEIGEVFAQMYRHFDSAKAVGLEGSFQFDISGEGGGSWVFKVSNGKCDFIVGGVDKPSIRISMSATDWKAIRAGRLNSQAAFMEGRLRVEGDMSLAAALQMLFPISSTSESSPTSDELLSESDVVTLSGQISEEELAEIEKGIDFPEQANVKSSSPKKKPPAPMKKLDSQND